MKNEKQQQVNTPEVKPEVKHGDRGEVSRLIARNVLDVLGQPGSLLQVQVRRLWDDHYRVNVLVGADPLSVTMSDSFFLRTDVEGKIVSSAPLITRRY